MKQNFYKLYGFRIIFVVVFLLGFIMMGSRRTLESNSNAVEDWLPKTFQETKDYQWYLRHFPFESFIVVSWEGCQFDDDNGIHEDQIELFAQKLVPGQTIDNFSLMAPAEEMTADLDVGKITDRLKPDASERPTSPASTPVAPMTAVAPVAETSAEQPAMATKAPNQEPEELYFRSVMTGPRLARLLEQSYSKTPQMNESPEELRNLVLDRLAGTLVGPDHKSTAMIITLNTGFKGGGKKMQELINRVKELSVECGLPNTTEVKTGSVAFRVWKGVVDTVREITYGRQPRTDGLILGGPPVDNAALDQEGTRTLFRLAAICAIISLTLAMICLRDFVLTMFVFWVAIISAGIAMAMVSFTGSKCDSILLSMPALVYVLAMSGSIHLINYYYDAIRDKGLDGAVERAVNHAFPPSFFAQLTTAIGLGSLFSSQLIPIIKFGFYSAVGVLTTLLLLFLYLPALLAAFPAKKFAKKYAHEGLENHSGFLANFWTKYGRFIVHYHNPLAILCFGAMIYFGSCLPNLKPSVKMMNFFSDDADIIAHYGWLEEKLGPLVPMELVVSFDNARLTPENFGTASRLQLVNRICRELKDKIRDKKDGTELVGGALSVATFAPELETLWTPGTTTFRIAQAAVGKNLEENRENLKDYLTIEGNPTVEEMGALLDEELKPRADNYHKQRDEIATLIRAAGEDENILGPDVTANDFDPAAGLSQTLEADVTDTAIRANLEELRKTEADLLNSIRLRNLVRAKSPELAKNGITDLDGILESVENNKPYKSVSTAEESTRLREVCRLWQEKRGIELWRISIRVWALKKDIDYSDFINQVKKVVQPLLSEVSTELLAGIGGITTDRYDYLATAGLADIAPPQNVLAGLTEKKVDLSYLKTDDPLLKDVRAEFGIDASETEIAQDGGPHANDIIFPAGISAKYTGMVPLVYKTQHALINGLVVSIIMAFFVIALVFVIYLRSFACAIVAMLPNIFPVVIVFGFMAWMGIPVDVGTMMTASVALGVAVDDTMHYLTWFSDGTDRGLTPKEAAVEAYKRCAPAMTESTLIAGLGLSAFAFSTFVPTQRFGILMLTILLVAEIGDLIFLASLLTGPAGRFFVNRRKKAILGLTTGKKQNQAV